VTLQNLERPEGGPGREDVGQLQRGRGERAGAAGGERLGERAGVVEEQVRDLQSAWMGGRMAEGEISSSIVMQTSCSGSADRRELKGGRGELTGRAGDGPCHVSVSSAAVSA
jgi:hypothetical protein